MFSALGNSSQLKSASEFMLFWSDSGLWDSILATSFDSLTSSAFLMSSSVLGLASWSESASQKLHLFRLELVGPLSDLSFYWFLVFWLSWSFFVSSVLLFFVCWF